MSFNRLLEDIHIWLAILGRKVGLALILSVWAWDLILYGTNGFQSYSICWKGALVQGIGFLLFWLGWVMERRLK